MPELIPEYLINKDGNKISPKMSARTAFLENGNNVESELRNIKASNAWAGTPTIAVNTLEPDSDATISIETNGEDDEKTLDFILGIPKGAIGATGEKGDKGNNGVDAITIDLSVNAWSIPAGITNAIASTQAVVIKALKGDTAQAITVGAISGLVTGLTAPITNNGTTAVTVTLTTATTLATKSGAVVIPITVDGKSFTRTVTWALSLTGTQGIPGTSLNMELIFSGAANAPATTYSLTKSTTAFKMLVICCYTKTKTGSAIKPILFFASIPVSDISYDGLCYIHHDVRTPAGTEPTFIWASIIFKNPATFWVDNYWNTEYTSVEINKIWGVY